nr:MAG TPA: hypothetical protein [Caudoviricetes sp.]
MIHARALLSSDMEKIPNISIFAGKILPHPWQKVKWRFFESFVNHKNPKSSILRHFSSIKFNFSSTLL